MKNSLGEKYEKTWSIILSLLLVLTLNLSSPVMAIENTEEISETHLYVETTNCPQAYIDYAEENILGYIESYSENVIPQGSITVGIPFAFLDFESDVYYFPIMINDEISYIFRVYPNGDNGFDSAISEFLAPELEKLSSLRSESTPLKMNRIRNKIIASIGDYSYTLYTYPNELYENDSLMRLNDISFELENTVVVDAKSDSRINIQFSPISRSSSNNWSYYINLNITETQGSNNWCAAYCTATIMRTLGYNATAEGIMSIFYRKPVSSNSITRQQVVTYAKSRGLNPIQVESTVPYETLRDNLRANRPVYFSMTRTGGNHAVVLRGYNSRRSTWSIWNPWINSYEVFSMYGNYVPTGYSSSTYSYTYARTIYNW